MRPLTVASAEPQANLRTGLWWVLQSLVLGHLTVVRFAAGLGVAGSTDRQVSTGSRCSAWTSTVGVMRIAVIAT